MEAALTSSAGELPNAARDWVARAKTMDANHDAALTLLTADALVTLACELECRLKDGP
jgi:hypothetical protein